MNNTNWLNNMNMRIHAWIRNWNWDRDRIEYWVLTTESTNNRDLLISKFTITGIQINCITGKLTTEFTNMDIWIFVSDSSNNEELIGLTVSDSNESEYW